MMAFGLQADAKITQVLFFKFRENQARLRHSSGRVTINPVVLAGVREDISRKLQAHARGFVAGLDVGI